MCIGETIESTEKVTIHIFNLNGDSKDDNTDFWADQIINATAQTEVSGDSADIQNDWILITVPKAKRDGYLIVSKPTFVDSRNTYISKKLEDNDNWYILYKFDVLSGGSNIASHFPFNL